MKKINIILFYCLALLPFFSIGQNGFNSLNIINQTFNDDPFISGDAATDYNFTSVNCPVNGYRIVANFNDYCTTFPNIPSELGRCMATSESGSQGPKTLYYEDGLTISPGTHRFFINTAGRGLMDTPVILEVLIQGTSVGTLVLPQDTEFIQSILTIYDIPTPATNVEVRILNPEEGNDFAVDHVQFNRLFGIDDVRDWNCIKYGDSLIVEGTTLFNTDIVGLNISQNGSQVVLYIANVDNDGRFWFQIHSDQLVADGVVRGEWFDINPLRSSSSTGIVVGAIWQANGERGFRLEKQTTGDVFFNTNQNNLDDLKKEFCHDEDIFYHGFAESSDRHDIQMRSRPIGSSEDFDNWQGGVFYPEEFEGASQNLQNDFNILGGFEYEITFGVSNHSSCIAWTAITDTIKVIDCCNVEGELIGRPECWNVGSIDSITVLLDQPIPEDRIESIFTTSPNFDYEGYKYIVLPTGEVMLTLYVTATSCSCDGQMVAVDILLLGCKEEIWVMTPNLPCCHQTCDNVTFEDFSLVSECLIVNGNKAFRFVANFTLENDIDINYINSIWSEGICPGGIFDLSFEVNGDNLELTGFVEVLDSDCERTDLIFAFDTSLGCCQLEIAVSLSGECNEECFELKAPEIERIIENGDSCYSIHISVPETIGSTILYTDNITGQVDSYIVGTILCQTVAGLPGAPCNGIIVEQCYECSEEEMDDSPISDSDYNFTIAIGECEFIIVGDYCDIEPEPDPDPVPECHCNVDFEPMFFIDACTVVADIPKSESDSCSIQSYSIDWGDGTSISFPLTDTLIWKHYESPGRYEVCIKIEANDSSLDDKTCEIEYCYNIDLDCPYDEEENEDEREIKGSSMIDNRSFFETQSEPLASISPNPVFDFVDLSLGEQWGHDISIKILDIHGQILNEIKFNNSTSQIKTIFTESLKLGFYIVQVSDEKGQTKLLKIVKN